MTAPKTLDQLLGAVEQLLDSQHGLALDGDADAMPTLNADLSALLGQLLAHAGTAAMTQHRARLVAIQKQALSVGTLLNRRQSDVRRALDAMGHHHRAISELQSPRVYAPAGLLVSTLHTRAMGSA